MIHSIISSIYTRKPPSKELVKKNLAQFLDIITSPAPLNPNQFGPMTYKVELIRKALLQNPDLKHTEDELAYLLEGVIEGMQRTIRISPESNAQFRAVLADTVVFCLTETNDNLLMWSHYAQNHTGAVIKFLSLPEVDSPLIMAEPVHYTTRMPRLRFTDLMGDFEETVRGILKTITLTKSDVWTYEKEWRIINALRNKTLTYEITPYAPEEVGEVYLGCNMAADDKDEIVELTRRMYPIAKLFQAEKHEREFALIFREIT